MENLPKWWPEKPPVYNIEKSYLDNFNEGPFFDAQMPDRIFPPKEEWKDFLGFPIASPLGVPAGPLLNARWVSFAAHMGFDVLTYKTIRSQIHPAHPLPNMIYVDTEGYLSQEQEGNTVHRALYPEHEMEKIALTNSFGMPSRPPDFVVKDIAEANASLQPGQVLIVSVVGTKRPGEDLIADFLNVAALARDAGAPLMEANFSCPNVGGGEGSIFLDPESVYQLTRELKNAIQEIPLIIKLGMIPDPTTFRKVLTAAARGGAQAICGINTVPMKVIKEDGSPALSDNRLQAGICGGPIRQIALAFLREATRINQEEKLGLTIMGTGGVTLPEHFDHFLEAGAEVAMTAVGMMWDPYLAARYHKRGSYVETMHA